MIEQATRLAAIGYWVVAIRPGEKRPIGAAWGCERWSDERLRAEFDRHPGAGIGICFGPGRGPDETWLIDLEGDGPEAAESLSRLVGEQGADQTAGWLSARGTHHLFTADGPMLLDLLMGAGGKEKSLGSGVWKLPELPGLELRIGGWKTDGIVKQIQSVCPPTVGDDGKPRTWLSDQLEPAALPESAYAFLRGLRKPAPAPTRPLPAAGTDIEKRAIAYLEKCEPAISGQRGHDKTFAVVCRVGPGFDLPQPTAVRLILDHYSPRCDPPWSEREIRHKVEDAYAAEPRRGWFLERDRAQTNGHAHAHANGHAAVASPPIPNGRLIILASEVTTRRVEWLWPDRIPIGKLTTFAGWGGLGKSFVTMDLAARVSRGGEIPGGNGECFQQAGVLILNTEDDPDDTSVPRLVEAEADLTRVGFAKSEVLGRFTLGDLEVLDRMVDQLGDVRLLVIDPATAHLGDANDHKNAELRALLMPLSLWAMERRIAVVLVTHVNKAQVSKVEAMARVMGSVAWVNAVRAAVMFSKDPEDGKRRLFIPFKSNCAPETKGLAYRIKATDSLAKVEWLGEVDMSADEALNSGGGRKPRRLEAAEWITDRFREKLEWFSDDLFTQAKQDGISRSAIFEAKKMLELPACKQTTNMDGVKAWIWWVPPNWPPLLENFRNSEPVNHCEDKDC